MRLTLKLYFYSLPDVFSETKGEAMINLIIKDIKNVIYDRKTLIMLIVMPIVLMSILGASLKGVFIEGDQNSGIKNIDVAIVKEYNFDQEKEKAIEINKNFFNTSDSQKIDFDKINPENIFFQDFLESKQLNGILRYVITDRASGEKMLEENKISALIILPKNYIYNTYINMTSAGRGIVRIETIKNQESQFSSEIAEMLVGGFLSAMNNAVSRKMVFVEAMVANDINMNTIEKLSDSIEIKNENRINIITKELTGEDKINSFQYYAVAIMSMFLLYAASMGGKALIEEKNAFTLQRAESSGISLFKMASSNLFRIIIIAIIQSVIMISFSRLFLGVNWGDIMTIIIALITSAISVGGMGFFVAILTLLTNKYYIANIFEFAIVNMMALIGGSFIPVEILPKALQKIDFLAINGSVLKIYLNAMKYRPIQESYIYIFLLLSIGFAFIFGGAIILAHNNRRSLI